MFCNFSLTGTTLSPFATLRNSDNLSNVYYLAIFCYFFVKTNIYLNGNTLPSSATLRNISNLSNGYYFAIFCYYSQQLQSL